MARRKREMRCCIPRSRFYLVEWEINDLIKLGLLREAPLQLWLILKGLSWELGMCDPTDEFLADWLGGARQDTVRRVRHELVELFLLLESSEEGHRWLTPLPVSRGMRARLPAPLLAESEAVEARLRAVIAAADTPGRMELTPLAGGVNEIDPQTRLKQQQDSSLSPEGENVAVVAVDVGGVVPGERGAGGEGAPAAAQSAEHAALAAYLEKMGAFPPVAAKLARSLLAGMDPDQARAYAQAHWLALTRTPPRGRELPHDELVRLWVTRLGFGGRARPALLAQGRLLAHLEAGQEAPAAAAPAAAAPAAAAVSGTAAASPEPDAPEPNTPEPEPDMPEAPVEDAAAPRVACTLHGEPCELPVAALWQHALGALRTQMARQAFDQWLADSRGVGVTEGGLVVEVASPQAAQILSVRLDRVVGRALASVAGRELAVTFAAREDG